jgi:bacillithiol system protein YtxJ
LNWIPLLDAEQLAQIKSDSLQNPVVIFKHSTTCSISQMAKMRLEDAWDLPYDTYYLDLKTYRSISNQIAEEFDVHHESPQILVIVNGNCIYDASHFDISVAEIKESIAFQASSSF